MNKQASDQQEPVSLGHKIGTVVGAVLCVILIPILIINCTLIIRSLTNKDDVPSIGGVFPMIVLTDSMSGVFESGDLIICRTPDRDIKVGDVITYYDPEGNGTTVVTHRVTEITTDADGIAYKTKGDANNTGDRTAVPAASVIGLYTGVHLAQLGRVVLFMQTTPGLILCVLLPLVLFVGYDVLRRRSLDRKNQSETDALRAELEALRAAKAAGAAEAAPAPEAAPEAAPKA